MDAIAFLYQHITGIKFIISLNSWLQSHNLRRLVAYLAELPSRMAVSIAAHSTERHLTTAYWWGGVGVGFCEPLIRAGPVEIPNCSHVPTKDIQRLPPPLRSGHIDIKMRNVLKLKMDTILYPGISRLGAVGPRVDRFQLFTLNRLDTHGKSCVHMPIR